MATDPWPVSAVPDAQVSLQHRLRSAARLRGSHGCGPLSPQAGLLAGSVAHRRPRIESIPHMKLPLVQIDAFTSRLFGGNPAAVVLLQSWLPDKVLASIAAENNLAETAFVIPGPDDVPLRWFTPTVEVDLCGHATLAAC